VTYWISARTRPPLYQWNQWEARSAAEALCAAEAMAAADMKKMQIVAPDGTWLDLAELRRRARAEDARAEPPHRDEAPSGAGGGTGRADSR
jgi:hypothetical protein